MNLIIPKKLKKGDLVRIIAPATSGSIISRETITIFRKRFEEDLGLRLEWSNGSQFSPDGNDWNNSTPIQVRLNDLHTAFADKSVAGIFTIIGGFNSNQLLPHIDYELIKQNPKVLCGYSDITALANGITGKTGMMTYIGPHASTFGMLHGIEYSLKLLKRCLFEEEPFVLEPSKEWRCDPWYIDQENVNMNTNKDGLALIWGKIPENPIKGISFGGNFMVFSLLQGTPYMPCSETSALASTIEESGGLIVFLESCHEFRNDMEERTIDQRLHSLLQVPLVRKYLKAIIWGRFEPISVMTIDKMKRLCDILLQDFPDVVVIWGADHGHTCPSFTFPIGGHVSISPVTGEYGVQINCLTH